MLLGRGGNECGRTGLDNGHWIIVMGPAFLFFIGGLAAMRTRPHEILPSATDTTHGSVPILGQFCVAVRFALFCWGQVSTRC